MIIPLPLIVSLLLAVIQATELKHKIELDRCSQDMACFVRDSCLKSGGSNAADRLAVFAEKDLDALNGNTCDIIIQMRALSKKKYLVIMQVTGSEPQEMKIEQPEDVTQVGCKDGVLLINQDHFSGSDGEYQFKPGSPYLCSFVMETNKNGIVMPFYNDGQKPQFVSGSDKMVFEQTGEVLWSFANDRHPCGTDITTSDSPTEKYKLSKVDVTKSPIKCGGKQLLVKYDGEDFIEDEVTCKGGTVKAYVFGNPEKKVVKEMEISCIEQKICNMCPALPPGCPGKECTPPENGEIDGCPTRKCTDNKYMIGEEKINHETTKPVECKKKKGSNEVSWHLEKDGVDPTPIDKLSCRSTVRCSASDLTLKCPDNTQLKDKKNCTAASVNEEGTALNKCPDGKKFYEGNQETNNYPTCNTKSGEWTEKEKRKGPFYCAEQKPEKKTGDNPSSGNIGVIVGSSFGVLAVLGVAGFLVFWFVWRPKQRAAKKIAPPSKGLSSKKSGGGKSAEGSKSKKDKKSSASDPPPDSSKKPSASGKEGSPDPATPADANKPPPSTDIEKLADKNSDPKNPPTPAAANEPPTPV